MLCVFLAFGQFFAIAGICYQEVKRKSAGAFLWATLLLMFGCMHLLDVIMGAYKYSELSMTKASLFVIFFCMFYELIRITLGNRYGAKTYYVHRMISKTGLENEKTKLSHYAILVFSSVLMCIPIILMSGGLLNTSWGLSRELNSAKNYFSGEQIWSILFNVFGGLLCVSLIKKEKKLAVLSFLSIMFVEIVTRDRVLVLPMLISFIAVYLFKIRRINFSSIIFAGISAVLVIFIVYGIRAMRWYGSLENLIRDFSFRQIIDRILMFLRNSDGELGLRNWFYYFIENENQFVNFGLAHTYLRMLFVFIPTRLSFGLKPNDFAQTMGTAIGMEIGGSVHPTLFGDCYANLGEYGILLGALWGIIVTCGDVISLKFKTGEFQVLGYVLLATTYVIMGRGAVYNGFFYCAWGILFLWGLNIFQLKIFKKSIKGKHIKWIKKDIGI